MTLDMFASSISIVSMECRFSCTRQVANECRRRKVVVVVLFSFKKEEEMKWRLKEMQNGLQESGPHARLVRHIEPIREQL